MKILVVGAAGDIGKAVCAELGGRHDLIRAGRSSGDVRVDLTDRASIRAMYGKLGAVDAVVSAAGEVTFAALPDHDHDSYMVGLNKKVMGQVDLVLEGLTTVTDGGSFTLTSGILNRDPIRMGSGAAMANGALDGFVTGAAIEMPRGMRINVVSPGVLDVSMPRYGAWFPGHDPVEAARVGRAFAKSVEGAITGKVIIVG